MTAVGTRSQRVGAVLLVILAAAVYLSFARSVPFLGDGRTAVSAAFEESAGLQPGDEVRLSGIEVGEVRSIRRDEAADEAIVTLAVDPEVRVSRDARMRGRWRTALGGSLYVDLDPGPSASPRLGEDEVLPSSRTAFQVGLDEVIDPLDGATPTRLRTTWRELATTLEGGAAEAAIDELSPGLETFARGLEPFLGTRDDDLSSLVRGAARTVSAIDTRSERLVELLEGGGAAFGAIAARRAALGTGLETAPAALDETLALMPRLERTLDRLDPLVAELRPGVGTLKPALRKAKPTLIRADSLLRSAEPLVDDVPPTLDALLRAARQGTPLISGLRPTVKRTRDELIPILGKRDENTRLRLYEAIGPALAGAGAAAGEFDGGGHMIHFPAPVDERSLVTAPCKLNSADPTADEVLDCRALKTFADLLGNLGAGG